MKFSPGTVEQLRADAAATKAAAARKSRLAGANVSHAHPTEKQATACALSAWEISDMTAAAVQKKPAPPTIEQLDTNVKRLEGALTDAERGRDAARTRLASLIELGDTDGIAAARTDRDLCEKKIPGIARDLAAAREDAKAALHRVRRATAARGYEAIREATAQQVGRAAKLEDIVDAFGAALLDFRQGMDSTDATTRAAGVMPDPYHLRAIWQGIVDIRLHLATKGVYGRMRTLESAHEINQAGRDSLRQATAAYQELSLQRARAALQMSGQQTEVA